MKSWAILHGRDYVIPDDVKEMLLPVWNHRLRLKSQARMSDVDTADILQEIRTKVPVPEEQVVRV